MKQPPDEIYLQFYGEGQPEDSTPVNGEVTWCEDRVFDSDVRYVLAKAEATER